MNQVLELSNGSVLGLDEKGYLLDPVAWCPEVAETMAATDGLELTSEHWLVLEIFRDYFALYDIEPPMRALVKRARKELNDEQIGSLYLYRLFPAGPQTQACRYAGLPRPVSCI